MSIELISSALNDSSATGTTKLVLIGLCNHANADGLCWPSVSRLATYARCNERTVQRHLRQLIELGEIRVVRKGGGRSATHYRIMLQERTQLRGDISVTGDTSVTSGVTSVSPHPRHQCHPNRNITINEPSLSNRSLADARTKIDYEGRPAVLLTGRFTPLFDEFWEQYPKKVGKGAARIKFDKAMTLVPFDELMAGLSRLNANLPSDPQFIPNPATWLNQERWTDEPASYSKQSADTGEGANQFLNVYGRLQSARKT